MRVALTELLLGEHGQRVSVHGAVAVLLAEDADLLGDGKGSVVVI